MRKLRAECCLLKRNETEGMRMHEGEKSADASERNDEEEIKIMQEDGIASTYASEIE